MCSRFPQLDSNAFVLSNLNATRGDSTYAQPVLFEFGPIPDLAHEMAIRVCVDPKKTAQNLTHAQTTYTQHVTNLVSSGECLSCAAAAPA